MTDEAQYEVSRENTRFLVRWLDQKLRPQCMPCSSETTARKIADIAIRGGAKVGATHVLKVTQTYEEELLTLREEETLND